MPWTEAIPGRTFRQYNNPTPHNCLMSYLPVFYTISYPVSKEYHRRQVHLYRVYNIDSKYRKAEVYKNGTIYRHYGDNDTMWVVVFYVKGFLSLVDETSSINTPKRACFASISRWKATAIKTFTAWRVFTDSFNTETPKPETGSFTSAINSFGKLIKDDKKLWKHQVLGFLGRFLPS